MDLKPIRTGEGYQIALTEVEGLMGAALATLEDGMLDLMIPLIEAYESKHFPVDLPDLVEAIILEVERNAESLTKPPQTHE